MQTATLKIDGMMCDACVGHVARALSELTGVQSAEVDLAAASATVTYDPDQVSVDAMKTAVEDEGYGAH